MPFSTGEASLPTVGLLYYNGVTFNVLHKSTVSMATVLDNANRTTKWVEYTIEVDATVTLEAGDKTTDYTMSALRIALETCGGALSYEGKGLGKQLVVNATIGGSTLRDVNWGPKPKLLHFQPLGGDPIVGNRSAQIRWSVTTCLPAVSALSATLSGGLGPVLQFNEETAVTYDDEDYSTLSIKGTLEIPMTRATVTTRTLTQTVDDYREAFMSQVAVAIDLTRFKVTRREFNVSRDKRTMEWSFAAEELPPMGLPIGATRARGTMNVKNIKPIALFPWLVTLRCTYTIRKDFPRRAAYWAFVSLMKFRRDQSVNAVVPTAAAKSADAQQKSSLPQQFLKNPGDFLPIIGPLKASYRFIFGEEQKASLAAPRSNSPEGSFTTLLLDFGFEEGLYEDSRSMTFHAAWKLFANMPSLIAASGVWKWDPKTLGGNVWKQSIQDISGWRSWLANRLDPTQDVIVDLGS